MATAWYAFANFSIDVNLTDGQTHQLALYLVDWDTTSRAERIDILDAGTGTVLTTQNVANFQNGVYLVWNVRGHVTIRITCTGGLNAVVSGLFFGS